jgi:hypothetical protein
MPNELYRKHWTASPQPDQLVNIISSVLALIVGWKLGLVVVFGALRVVVSFGWLRICLQGKMDELNSQRFTGSTGLAGFCNLNSLIANIGTIIFSAGIRIS